MKCESTHLQIYGQFDNGYFEIQLSTVKHLALLGREQIHKFIVSQGMIETAVDRSQRSENTTQFAGIAPGHSSWAHKESTGPRVKRDESDIKNIVSIVQNVVDPFLQSVALTYVSTAIRGVDVLQYTPMFT